MKALCNSVLLLFLFSYQGFGQKTSKNGDSSIYDCSTEWKYFNLQNVTTGKVIQHITSGPCGTLAFASITIIKLSNNDTIRVLELCNDKKEFSLDDFVTITPAEKPEFGVSLPLIIERNSNGEKQNPCRILRTCYAVVTLSKRE